VFVGVAAGAYGFVLRLTHKTDVKLYAYAGAILAGFSSFFSYGPEFCGSPVRSPKRAIPETATGESAAPVPEM